MPALPHPLILQGPAKVSYSLAGGNNYSLGTISSTAGPDLQVVLFKGKLLGWLEGIDFATHLGQMLTEHANQVGAPFANHAQVVFDGLGDVDQAAALFGIKLYARDAELIIN